MEESWSKRNRLLEGQKESKNQELDGKRKQGTYRDTVGCSQKVNEEVKVNEGNS